MERWGDYWRFTDRSVRTLLEGVFSESDLTVKTYGNVFAASKFLYGYAAEEIALADLNDVDPDYQLIISAAAIKMPA
jgi:hypothetical protein